MNEKLRQQSYTSSQSGAVHNTAIIVTLCIALDWLVVYDQRSFSFSVSQCSATLTVRVTWLQTPLRSTAASQAEVPTPTTTTRLPL